MLRWFRSCAGNLYRYLTNVLDPEQLSARQVGTLSPSLADRRTFLADKRLLGLSYLWSRPQRGADSNLRHLDFYAVLVDVLPQVAAVLGQPRTGFRSKWSIAVSIISVGPVRKIPPSR